MKTPRVLLLFFPIAAVGQDLPSPPHQHAAPTNTVRVSAALVNRFADEMRTNHPALRALDARVRAATHATNAVRTWEDPRFKLGGVIASERGPSLHEDGNLVYGLEQKLPLFGKPAAARRVAQTEADTALSRQAMQFQVLRRDLAKLLFQAAYEERSLGLGSQDLAWLETMAATAEERYRAGSGSLVEVLRMQNERARRADLLRTDMLHRDHSLLAVNRLLNRDLHAPLPRLELPDVATSIPYGSNLITRAAHFEPRLRLLAREIKTAEAQVAATRKSRWPEFNAGIEGRQYTGDGGFREGLFTVGLNLPWFNSGKYRSDLARDRARLDAAEFDAADLTLAVREEVHHLTVAIDAARREALLYRDEIIPRSRQALDVAHAQWLNNRGLFLDVMEARRMLLDAQVMSAKAISVQYQAMSDLVLSCGLADLDVLANYDAANSPTSAPDP